MRCSCRTFQRTFTCSAGAATPNVSMSSFSSNGRGRGHLWHRGFCDRPQGLLPSDVEFVSGDLHLRAVSTANYGFRWGYENSLVPRLPYPTTGPSPQLRPLPQAGFRPSPQRFRPSSPNNHNNSRGFYPGPPPGWRHPQFVGPPLVCPWHRSHEFRLAGGYNQANSGYMPRPPPGIRPHQGWRPPPRARPADFRDWVSSTSTQVPPQAERFKVLSYNILADYLARDHRDELYFHIPEHILDWEWRKKRLLIEFGLWSPDILCLQEVDRFQDLEQELSSRGFNGIWKMRTGTATDGCAMFWRSGRFELLNEESIQFNRLGLRDNVAQICVLEIKADGKDGVESGAESLPPSPIQSTEAKRIVICNIHVLYNPKRGEIKLGQVRTLIDQAYSVSRKWNNAPVIICGDFNSTPKSPLYNFISMQKLGLSGLARDQISGQYSSARLLPNAPFFFGYRRSGSPPEGNALKRDPKHNFDGESCETTLSSTLPAHSTENFIEVTKPNFSHQSGGERHEQSPVAESGTSNVGYYITSISDEKLVSNLSQQCNQVDLSSVASKKIIRQEVTVEETSYIIDAGSEGIGSSNEINVIKRESNSSVSSRTSAIELSDSNLADGDRTKCNLVRDIHCNEERLDLGSLNLWKESNKASLFVMEGRATPEVCLSRSKDYVLAREEMDKNCAGIMSHAELQENIADSNLEKNDSTEEDDGTTSQVSQFDDGSNLNFLAELHGTTSLSKLTENHNSVISKGNYKTLSGQLNVDFQNHVQDLYSWTPVESEIASGNKDCTLLQHNLKLKSAYATVGDPTGTKDSGGEPQVTSCNRRFMGTVDYIWFSDGLQAVKVLGTIPRDVLQKTRGFPTAKWGSDHIAIVCEFAFHGN